MFSFLNFMFVKLIVKITAKKFSGPPNTFPAYLYFYNRIKNDGELKKTTKLKIIQKIVYKIITKQEHFLKF